jgi:hypothetical protein
LRILDFSWRNLTDMITSLFAILATAALGSLLIPVFILVLALTGFFPPLEIRIWGWQTVIPPQTRTTGVDVPAQKIKIDQDLEDDVIYITLGDPVESYVEEAAADDTICYRRSYGGNYPSGITIMSFEVWRNKLPDLATVVASYLGVSKRSVEISLSQLQT